MPSTHQPSRFTDALHLAEIRLFLGAVGCYSLGRSALAVIISFQIWQITHSKLALGLLGLIEAIPAIAIAPFGGYIADHFNRRRIMIATRAVSFACALGMALLSWETKSLTLTVEGLFAMIFLAGVARGFADPAGTAFEAQVVPKTLTVNASSWLSSTWILSSVAGPMLGTFIFAAVGAARTYLVIAALFFLALTCIGRIASKPQPRPAQKDSVLKSIHLGWQFLRNDGVLLPSMTLDLFAVFFGGAIALLPVYADQILHVGVRWLGVLTAAPTVGSLVITLVATHKPPIRNAGRTLLVMVAGFGVSILVFAWSKNFYLSMAALFFSGIFDGVSMIIRRSIIRLLSPDEMRGRIASVSGIFICASNELGACESGLLAAAIGTVPCVALGGMVTLVVAGVTALKARRLRELSFDPRTMERLTKAVPKMAEVAPEIALDVVD